MAYAAKSLRQVWAGNQKLFVTPEAIRALKANAVVAGVVTKDMAAAGVPILAGCDAMLAGFCVHDELVAMVRGGMPSSGALRTVTINPARYFGLQQTHGSVAVGKTADLVLLDANPLEDITNVRRIRAVIRSGRFMDRKQLNTLLEQVKSTAPQQ
jgi:imidazolonepropionase-like amidohydrolase